MKISRKWARKMMRKWRRGLPALMAQAARKDRVKSRWRRH